MEFYLTVQHYLTVLPCDSQPCLITDHIRSVADAFICDIGGRNRDGGKRCKNVNSGGVELKSHHWCSEEMFSAGPPTGTPPSPCSIDLLPLASTRLIRPMFIPLGPQATKAENQRQSSANG